MDPDPEVDEWEGGSEKRTRASPASRAPARRRRTRRRRKKRKKSRKRPGSGSRSKSHAPEAAVGPSPSAETVPVNDPRRGVHDDVDRLLKALRSPRPHLTPAYLDTHDRTDNSHDFLAATSVYLRGAYDDRMDVDIDRTRSPAAIRRARESPNAPAVRPGEGVDEGPEEAEPTQVAHPFVPTDLSDAVLKIAEEGYFWRLQGFFTEGLGKGLRLRLPAGMLDDDGDSEMRDRDAGDADADDAHFRRALMSRRQREIEDEEGFGKSVRVKKAFYPKDVFDFDLSECFPPKEFIVPWRMRHRSDLLRVIQSESEFQSQSQEGGVREISGVIPYVFSVCKGRFLIVVRYIRGAPPMSLLEAFERIPIHRQLQQRQQQQGEGEPEGEPEGEGEVSGGTDVGGDSDATPVPVMRLVPRQASVTVDGDGDGDGGVDGGVDVDRGERRYGSGPTGIMTEESRVVQVCSASVLALGRHLSLQQQAKRQKRKKKQKEFEIEIEIEEGEGEDMDIDGDGDGDGDIDIDIGGRDERVLEMGVGEVYPFPVVACLTDRRVLLFEFVAEGEAGGAASSSSSSSSTQTRTSTRTSRRFVPKFAFEYRCDPDHRTPLDDELLAPGVPLREHGKVVVNRFGLLGLVAVCINGELILAGDTARGITNAISLQRWCFEKFSGTYGRRATDYVFHPRKMYHLIVATERAVFLLDTRQEGGTKEGGILQLFMPDLLDTRLLQVVDKSHYVVVASSTHMRIFDARDPRRAALEIALSSPVTVLATCKVIRDNEEVFVFVFNDQNGQLWLTRVCQERLVSFPLPLDPCPSDSRLRRLDLHARRRRVRRKKTIYKKPPLAILRGFEKEVDIVVEEVEDVIVLHATTYGGEVFRQFFTFTEDVDDFRHNMLIERNDIIALQPAQDALLTKQTPLKKKKDKDTDTVMDDADDGEEEKASADSQSRSQSTSTIKLRRLGSTYERVRMPDRVSKRYDAVQKGLSREFARTAAAARARRPRRPRRRRTEEGSGSEAGGSSPSDAGDQVLDDVLGELMSQSQSQPQSQSQGQTQGPPQAAAATAATAATATRRPLRPLRTDPDGDVLMDEPEDPLAGYL